MSDISDSRRHLVVPSADKLKYFANDDPALRYRVMKFQEVCATIRAIAYVLGPALTAALVLWLRY